MKEKNKKETDSLDIINRFNEVINDPAEFLIVQPTKYETILGILQDVYKFASHNDIDSKSAMVLPCIVTEDMDEEQIWQQLEIRNDFVLPILSKQASKLLEIPEQKLEIRLKEDDDEVEEDVDEASERSDNEENNLENGIESDNDDSNDEDFDSEEDEMQNFDVKEKKPKKTLRKSIVDDEFFKLGEMEEFLEAEEAKDMRKQNRELREDDVDGIDYFAEDFGEEDNDDSEDDAGYKINYKDFYDSDKKQKDKPLKNKKDKDHFESYENGEEVGMQSEDEDDNGSEKEVESDDDDDGERKNSNNIEPASGSDTDSEAESQQEDDDKPKSSFELRQRRLEQRIKDYEQVVLGEKPWQLKGEVQGTNRPQNSLLEEILEFDSTVRPAPVITEQTTQCLEDIIKQRIKDQAWDDVVRKVRPTQTPQEYRKQLILDQEKSKESLAQIYEKEYQREIDKLNPNRNDDVTEDPKEHQEIRRMMSALFVKLDALSNFHFTPKPVAPEPKIITNTPAVAMEEVAPVAVSDANLLAPEEVYRGPKSELIGKSERSRTEKNRERRKKKNKQRAVHKALEAKDLQRQKLGIPLTKKEENAKLLKQVTKHRNVEKVTISNDHTSLKSSKAFFAKLQDTKAQDSTKKAAKRKVDAASLSAKKLKL